ncbi:mitochondrial tRNA-specific 2-thiouridylase 1 isoform X2 [Cephus cinctus]|uniref:tRNA-5-taurinomethyluridine 2-sulfurtransferase n=1 Tax=Cephus cinctus TaxID=211228 RepID=A0AAJ7BFF0_CEPCN|nr:mitochondrial tRNA-specific 2-thiouridylase 1 isoform X2 [Cephus cinctus]
MDYGRSLRSCFNVTAVFMKNWDITDETGYCTAEKDYEDAKWVCDKLKVPLLNVNFVKEYWNTVFSELVKEYESGYTPNPDIQCNKCIKFDMFYNFARNELKADAIATGHYVRTNFGPYLENFQPNINVKLLKASDSRKDQTFFLSQVPQKALCYSMFPIGSCLKKDVKKIAQEAGLNLIVQKKESMGICFIGSRRFKDFITEYVQNKSGNFVDIDTGVIVGTHEGIHQWTLGQRCKIGGKPQPYFVYKKDLKSNDIFVVAGTNHPALFAEFIIASEIYWIDKEPVELQNSHGILRCYFRFQHLKPLVPCNIYKTQNNQLLIKLDVPLRAITPGQYTVLYSGEECLGSAKVLHCGPSYHLLSDQFAKQTSKEISLDLKGADNI